MNANTDTANLISVESAPALIKVNFDEVKAQLSEELAKYDVVVTQDTIKDAKSLATQLNKNASEFDKRRKDAVAQVSGPIREFETQMKELVTMCKEGRQKIVDQVRKFEDETKAKALDLLAKYLGEQWDEKGIDPEFRKAQITDLVKLTAITKTENLTASSVKAVQERVNADKQLQDQTEMRLLKLENESYKAGLTAPLTRAHIESFLFADEEDYQERLSQVMESEVEREKKTQDAMRAKIQKEEQERLEAQERGEAQKRGEEAMRKAKEEASPQPEAEPEPAQQRFTPPTQPAQQPAEQHAYGLLSDPTKAVVAKCSFDDALNAIRGYDLDVYGIWTKSAGLIAIIHYGEVFRKA